jgi:hypothetical protein
LDRGVEKVRTREAELVDISLFESELRLGRSQDKPDHQY